MSETAITAQEIKALIEQGMSGATALVQGDDGRHFQATVISEEFAGLSLVKKQQRVYATINPQIASGAIHAISMQTYTPAEWEKKQKFGF